MMDHTLMKLTDISFPVSIIEHLKTRPGPLFDAHLHEHYLQIFYFTYGKANMYYNQTACNIQSPDVLLINRHELHYGENASSELRYFVFRIDLRLLSSYHIAPCSQKYLEPLENGLVFLQNHIENQNISAMLKRMIEECKKRQDGYEFEILACVFELLGELFRNHKEKSYTPKYSEMLMKKTKRFADVFDYIEKNYTRDISLAEASTVAHMSEGYFCRMFRQSTGRTLTDYVNRLRIEKSVLLLNQGVCNVTEAAMSVGFDDINYFSRVFKKYMKQSPANYLQNDRKYFL
ncbi:AraC family transcriptional regulator [Ethanoligenens harbinense]|nr:AraC family transcriptional regulator [Ethanoligenens harbinense]